MIYRLGQTGCCCDHLQNTGEAKITSWLRVELNNEISVVNGPFSVLFNHFSFFFLFFFTPGLSSYTLTYSAWSISRFGSVEPSLSCSCQALQNTMLSTWEQGGRSISCCALLGLALPSPSLLLAARKME
ncbi:hypothetical protein BD289DRAFT_28658 [Coniella lustricola]|uniref:Uncharacterized protein n=1 Tax=Coniella lustricola TaxID=2025994 RepID=A0A2T3AJ18_9PEZI|nr:hypothetical protein BD289DRAFT_28658 [Coniella lustricola]